MKKWHLMGSVVFLLATASVAGAQEDCNEYFNVGSSPSNGWLGKAIDGSNYGQGQSFDLNCGSRLESVAFKINWGNDVGDIRSLAYGDTVFLSILTLDGTELLRRGTMIDTSLGSRTITHYLTVDNVLLPPAVYVAAVWTNVEACGGISYYNADVVAGSRYLSANATDFTSWGTASGELYHTVVVDSDVTPVDGPAWGAVKACYR